MFTRPRITSRKQRLKLVSVWPKILGDLRFSQVTGRHRVWSRLWSNSACTDRQCLTDLHHFTSSDPVNVSEADENVTNNGGCQLRGVFCINTYAKGRLSNAQAVLQSHQFQYPTHVLPATACDSTWICFQRVLFSDHENEKHEGRRVFPTFLG